MMGMHFLLINAHLLNFNDWRSVSHILSDFFLITRSKHSSFSQSIIMRTYYIRIITLHNWENDKMWQKVDIQKWFEHFTRKVWSIWAGLQHGRRIFSTREYSLPRHGPCLRPVKPRFHHYITSLNDEVKKFDINKKWPQKCNVEFFSFIPKVWAHILKN